MDPRSASNVNVILSQHFTIDRARGYDHVSVLALYWKNADSSGYKGEAVEVCRFFEDTYNFRTEIFEIPWLGSTKTVLDRVYKHLDLQTSPHSLTIIHYGGHGDPDNGPEKAIWTPRGHRREATLRWSTIQGCLEDTKGRVLLLLDCCFAAQAARQTDRVIPGNVELHAACARGCTTSSPGTLSFTLAWLDEAKRTVDANKPVCAADLQHSLSSSEYGILATPVYYPLDETHGRTIKLLPPPKANSQAPSVPLSSFLVRLDLACSSPEESISSIVDWLKNAPQEVFGMKIQPNQPTSTGDTSIAAP